MIANRKALKKSNHCIKHGDFKLLKFSAIYGANASGKSNFIKCFKAVSDFIMLGSKAASLRKSISKTRKSLPHNEQSFLIEIIASKTTYIYKFTVDGEVILRESLSISGLGKSQDKLIFSRRNSTDGRLEIECDNALLGQNIDEKFIEILKGNILKPTKSLVQTICEFENRDSFKHIVAVYEWFEISCEIVSPVSRAKGITTFIQNNSEFRDFCLDIFKKVDVGVDHLEVIEQEIEEYINDGNKIPHEFMRQMDEIDSESVGDRELRGSETIFEKNGDKTIVKRIQFIHQHGDGVAMHPFDFSEESDGTVRLFNLLPMLYFVVKFGGVAIVDEIERSIHPVLIKKIIAWLSGLEDMRGQLIFTTHESGLLDNEIIRQDEIWFCEKDLNGNSSMYSLTEFKEHHTLDLRRGYLAGRYGAIPKIRNFNVLQVNNG